MRIVVALGGNALLRRGERPDADVQRANTVRVADALAALGHEHDLVVTHGNEPQLALLAAQSGSASAQGSPYPLDLLGAQTQGMIGTLLVRALRDVLPGRHVVSLVTHTLVAADDHAFRQPTVSVRRRGRAVASPSPVRIVETETVRALLDLGTLVVCAGGGGIAVVADRDTGLLGGTEVVVDKDLAAARLAEDLKADFLLVLTDVPNVYAEYGTAHQRPVLDVTPSELRSGHYPDRCMGPKTEAAARFVERTGGLAAIGALDAAYEIVHGRSGTLVRPDLPVP